MMQIERLLRRLAYITEAQAILNMTGTNNPPSALSLDRMRTDLASARGLLQAGREMSASA